LQVEDAQESWELRIRESSSYPKYPPVVSIISPGLPAFIRLSMIRQLVQKANMDFLGAPMIFNLVDWLETEIPRILQNPGRLGDVSAGTLGIAKNAETTRTSFLKHQGRPNLRIDRCLLLPKVWLCSTSGIPGSKPRDSNIRMKGDNRFLLGT
jgi:hypothetical protein